MMILEDDFEQLYYDRTSDYLNLAIEYGEIINQYQDKIVSLKQENKRLKRDIWNLKKTKGKQKIMANQMQVSHKDFFNSPAVKNKLSEVVSGKSDQFIASLLSIVNNNKLLSNADNHSILTAAMKAATLNLPIEPSLGFAYIVPYKRQAQFQLGYKGLIQLAIRSGQVKNINSGVIYKAQFKSYDPLFETLEVDFSQPEDEVAGYFATLELLNGFKKLIYWTRERAYHHGKRFSKSFGNSPWQTDFDAMAQKTLLKQIISKYAPLSTELQEAITADNETEDEKAVPIDVTPQEESLTDLIGETPQEEVPTVDPETGEIQEEQTALFDQLRDLTDD